MRLTLNSLLVAPVLLAALAFTSKPVEAEILHVPFAFSVPGAVFTAGTYNVENDIRGQVVYLRSLDGTKHFQWVVGPGSPAPTATGAAMVFDKSGSGYSLRTIRYHAKITPELDKKTRNSEDREVHIIR